MAEVPSSREKYAEIVALQAQIYVVGTVVGGSWESIEAKA